MHKCLPRRPLLRNILFSEVSRRAMLCALPAFALASGAVPAMADDLIVDGPNSPFNIVDGTYGNLTVGDTGTGVYQLTDGSSRDVEVTDTFTLGNAAGSSGAINLDGGSHLRLKLSTPKYRIVSGGAGDSSLSVLGGSTLNWVQDTLVTSRVMFDDLKSITVSGPGSTLAFDLGVYDTGDNRYISTRTMLRMRASSILISDGAHVSSAFTSNGVTYATVLAMGANNEGPMPTGDVKITGAGTTVTAATILYGSTNFEISDGAQIISPGDNRWIGWDYGLFQSGDNYYNTMSMHITGPNTRVYWQAGGASGSASVVYDDFIIDDGAKVVDSAMLYYGAGRTASSPAVFKVDGAGSSYTGSWLRSSLVKPNGDDFEGNGYIAITNGGVINIEPTNGAKGIYSRDESLGNFGSVYFETSVTLKIDGQGSALNISGQAVGMHGRDSGYIDFTGSLNASRYKDGVHGVLTVSNGGRINARGIKTVGSDYRDRLLQGSLTVNIGAAADQSATGAGLLDISEITTQFCGKQYLDCSASGPEIGIDLVFNHTDDNYVFAPSVLRHTHVNAVAGRTILTADNDYMDGTETHAGAELQIGNGGREGWIVGDVANDGTLAFDREDDVDFAGSISGSGLIAQRGSGTLRLSGDSSAFAGATRAESGVLLVDGILGGTVDNVASGATIGGAGTIKGNLTVGSGGALTGRGGNTLTVGGNLTLANDSTTEVALGSSHEASPFHVNGDLTIGGTLNVTNLNGDFGAGVYRIFDYDGTLTDNGMMLGTVEGGDPSQMGIQTNIDHQVNLVNREGTALAYWDGADAANHGNSRIDGGDGVWTHAPNASWTGDQGVVNGGWTDGALAVFTGKGGTVTVDDSAGAITANGMQFAVDGYRVEGDAIVLDDDNAPVIRVGDKAKAVVVSELRGTKGLKKTDYGTLVLAGDNSYTGGTTVNEGTLQLGDGGRTGSILGDIVLAETDFDTGSLAFNRSDAFDFSGNISGEGAVYMRGTGVTTLSGDNSFAGGLTVESGTVRAGSNTAFSSGKLAINRGAAADLNGFGQSLATVDNDGMILFGGHGGTTLNVAGNYAGDKGAIVMNTRFDGDNSTTDRLVVAGNTSGETTLKFVNQGGAGALTDKGIKVIEVSGSSHGDFKLAGDFVTADGQQAVVGGAYAYTLHQYGLDTPEDGDWYLRSRSGFNGDGDGPILNPGLPTYTTGTTVIDNINKGGFGGLGERTRGGGNGSGLNAGRGTGGNGQARDGASDADNADGIFRDHYVWGRIESAFGSFTPNGNIANSTYESHDWHMQAGVDGVFNETRNGTFMGSVWLDYVNSQADVSSKAGDGKVDVNGYGFGMGLTWFGDNGFYVDGEGKLTWYRSSYDSSLANKTVADGVNSFGYAMSLEAGQKFTLNSRWSVTPQAQLIWSSVNTDTYHDAFHSTIDTPVNNSLTARLGTSVDYANSWIDKDGTTTRLSVGGIASLYQQLNNTADYIVISDERVAAGTVDRTWGELGMTVNYSWMNDKYAVYGKLSGATSFNHFNDSYTANGNVGFRMKW